VRYGYGGDADFAQSPPDAVFDSLELIPPWLARQGLHLATARLH